MQMTRKQFLFGSLLGYVAVATGLPYMIGCAAGAALPFITLGLNLIGTVLPTIPSIIASISTLAGHNVLNESQVAKLTQVFQGVQDLFKQVEVDLNQFQANNDPTLVAKIKDALTLIQTDLKQGMADVQITDTATVTKITGIVNSFIDLTNNVLLLLPVVSNGKIQARKPTHAQLAQVDPKVWAAKFNRTVSTPSGNSAVDTAFADVKAVPKQ